MPIDRRARRGLLTLALTVACGPDAPAETTGGDTSSSGTSGTTIDTTGPVDPTTSTGAPDPTTSTSTSTATGSSSTTAPLDPGCGDGVAEPGEVCFEFVLPEHPSYLTHPVLADMNEDGHLDIAAVTLIPCPLVHGPALAAAGPAGAPRDAASIVQLLIAPGDGAGNFVAGLDVFPDYEGTGELVAVDFTGDGHLDLGFPGGSGGDKLLLVFPGDGAGNLGAAIESPIPMGLDSLAAGDLDGDGDLDLVGASYHGLVVLLGDGLGGFTSTILTADAQHDRPVLHDLDGDGDLDFVVLRNYPTAVETHFNGGDGTFIQGENLPIGGYVNDLVVVRPTVGDGAAALVSSYESMVGRKLHAFHIEEDGVLTPAGPMDLDVTHLAVGRFDGAPRPDVLAIGTTQTHAILGAEPWPPPPTFVFTENFAVQARVAAGDINEDGVDDVVIPESGMTVILRSRP